MPVESFQTLIVYATDCSVAELNSTIGMIVTLLKHRKITNGDIELAMTKQVESIIASLATILGLLVTLDKCSATLRMSTHHCHSRGRWLHSTIFSRPLCVQTRSVANRDHVILVLVHLRHTLSQLK